ncbi:MAG TPA: M23 family peptidase, partial [Chryseosolibacter sp.]
AQLYSKGLAKELKPDYANNLRAVYLIDLRKQLPDSVVACGKSVVPHLKVSVPSGREYNYYSQPVDIEFPDKALYDTVYLNVRHEVAADSTEKFIIGPRTVPLDKAIKVTIRPTTIRTWDPSYAVYRMNGRAATYLGGGWENGGLHFATREFGEFTILRDTVPPTIKVISVNNTAVRFKIRDNLSGIKDYQATINGKWLLMHYDAKSATIWSEKLNKAEPLKGEFKLVVSDESGNETTYTHKLF